METWVLGRETGLWDGDWGFGMSQRPWGSRFAVPQPLNGLIPKPELLYGCFAGAHSQHSRAALVSPFAFPVAAQGCGVRLGATCHHQLGLLLAQDHDLSRVRVPTGLLCRELPKELPGSTKRAMVRCGWRSRSHPSGGGQAPNSGEHVTRQGRIRTGLRSAEPFSSC